MGVRVEGWPGVEGDGGESRKLKEMGVRVEGWPGGGGEVVDESRRLQQQPQPELTGCLLEDLNTQVFFLGEVCKNVENCSTYVVHVFRSLAFPSMGPQTSTKGILLKLCEV
eukprot:6792177-Pyramimonas_sp.AAC.1